jgi:hypothetical protein
MEQKLNGEDLLRDYEAKTGEQITGLLGYSDKCFLSKGTDVLYSKLVNPV